MEEPMHMGFANFEAWQRFNQDFAKFVKHFEALARLRDKVFVRKIYPKHHADYIIYGLGRVCSEDFEQILNLCGNGFGIGAMQLLRSMYERQVTAAFLVKHPDQVDQFTKYDYVHTRKLTEQLKEVYKDEPDILNSIVSEDERRKIEENYQAVKKDFMTECKKCKAPQPMFSWHKSDIGTMASKGQQPELKAFFPYQYFRPLLMGHSTFKSVEARVVFHKDGSFSFESTGQSKFVKEAIVNAHHLLLHVLELQNNHFQLGFDAELEQCGKDYLECWAATEKDSEAKALAVPAELSEPPSTEDKSQSS